MKLTYRIASLAIALFAIIGLSFSGVYAQKEKQFSKEQVLLSVILTHVDQFHFEPAEYNDAYSEKIYDLYIKNLDNQKRFLLQEDVDELEKSKFKLDDAVRDLSFDFYERSVEMIESRQEEAEGYIKDILGKPFDLTVNEEIDFDSDNQKFAGSKKELKDYWRKLLKYQTLDRMMDLKSEDEHKEKSSEDLEALAREKVLKRNTDWFTRLYQQDADDRFAVYVNAITQSIDPHSSYYPPAEKANFDISMSGKLEGIGARLQQEGPYTKVVDIIPGSPSAAQGELEKEDFIIKVAQKDEEPLDVVDMPLDEVVKFIRGPKGTEVTLTVKKIDGSIKQIPIIRDVVVLEETYAKSAIIEEDGKRMGYIFLPSFYSDFGNPDGRDCYKDVKAIVEQLKTESIDGIVFDLRNNTGGYLFDAVQMAGLFIEEGPIVQVKGKGKESIPKIHKDADPDIVYDGPLVVLVNTFSASASEIFAAAVQDYNRGIVIGSESTYGKGTVQRFFDLDRMLANGYDYVKPLGSIKMTIQKFYRINGGSTQQKGVEPDIVLPDQYSFIDVGEKEKDNVMPWTEIGSLSYDDYSKLSAAVNALQSKSLNRVQQDMLFKKVTEQAKWLKEQRDNSVRSLEYDAFVKEEEKFKEINEQYKDLFSDIDNMMISNTKEDLAVISADEEKKERNEKWFEDLKKDIYLYEAVNVMQDF